MNFLPTYLYIKQHSITGKLYFGKTNRDDPIKYPGSGTHWKNHFKKHGKEHVETLWYCLFDDRIECTEFALMCSKQWDIVDSDQWLNKIPEDGLGCSQGHMMNMAKASATSPNHISKNSEFLKQYVSSSRHVSKNPDKMKRIQAASNLSPLAKHKDPLHIKMMNEASISSKNHNTKAKVICPHCKMEGQRLIMSRYHFDRCKHYSDLTLKEEGS